MCKLIGSDDVIERAYEELNQFNWTEEELLTYEQEVKRIMDNRAAEDYKLGQIKQQIIKAEAKGKAEGKIERDIEIAKEMLLAKEPMERIIKYTKLTKEQIVKLK